MTSERKTTSERKQTPTDRHQARDKVRRMAVDLQLGLEEVADCYKQAIQEELHKSKDLMNSMRNVLPEPMRDWSRMLKQLTSFGSLFYKLETLPEDEPLSGRPTSGEQAAK